MALPFKESLASAPGGVDPENVNIHAPINRDGSTNAEIVLFIKPKNSFIKKNYRNKK
jgi:hypothetical protein